MADTTLEDKKFPLLKSYAAFLLENYVDEATEMNLEIARKVELPLLSLFSHLSEQELLQFGKQSLHTFLSQLIAESALEGAKDSLRKWRSGTLPYVSKNGVETADIVLNYHVRKQLLLGLVLRYTTAPEKLVAIAQELNDLYAEIELFAFSMFVDHKQEENEEFNLILQEEQVKLEEAYEELRTSQEELQETNEQLKEQVRSRITTEEALEKERNYFKAILENISDGIVACDENGLLSYFNQATRAFHGIPEKPLPAEQWSTYYNLYHADGKTPLSKEEVPLFRAFTGEAVKDKEMVIAQANGFKKTLLAKGQPIYTSKGKKVGAVVVMHDVTDLKQAQREQLNTMLELHEKNKDLAAALEELQSTEEQLIEANNRLEIRVGERTRELLNSEQQMRLITDALPVLISFVDAEETFRFSNKTFEEWFGQPRNELYGKKLKEVIGDAPYEKVKGAVKRALQGESVYLETKIQFEGIGQKHLSFNYVPYRVDEKVAGYFALITDISAHKKAQEELERANREITTLLLREKVAYADAEASRSRLYNLFMQAPALLCILRGKDLVYELANPTYLQVFGIKEPIEGKALKEVLSDLEPAVINVINHVIETGERFIGREFPVASDWKQNGEPYTRYFNLIYEPLRESDSSMSGLIIFGYEVTDHVEARQALEQSSVTMQHMNLELSQKNKELEKINNDLDNFVYTASHDLRSPVVNLQGLLTALTRHLRNQDSKNPDLLIEMMDKSVIKLIKTIQDLTEITRAQKGLEEPEEKVPVPDMLEDIKIDLQQSIQEANPIIREELQVTTITYPRRNLRSILYNLLTNAIKYKDRERPLKIYIKTYQEDGYIVLSVQDNGLGMSEQQLPKLFTMFKRMHTHVEGTGIGLYIVKRIVENYGGKIEVSSQQDKGTTFKVYLTRKE